MNRKNLQDYLLAALSGVLLTASFPPARTDWIVWFALLPLFKALEEKPPFRAFKIGLLAGFIHAMTLIYWIVVVLGRYGGLNLTLSLGVLILFCLYLSLYPALFSFGISYLKESRIKALVIASTWVSLEFLRAKLMTGFPWCLLGHTQYGNLYLIQITDMVGVYGLSFLIVFTNAVLYHALRSVRGTATTTLKWEMPILALLLLSALSYGHFRLIGIKEESKGENSIRVAVVQGNIDQSVKWNSEYQAETIAIYRRLTQAAEPFKPDLVLWPETSVPFFFQNDTDLSREVIGITKQVGAHLIFGSPAYTSQLGKTRYRNRAYHLAPNGTASSYYDKVHLVPFGEYVPLKKFLPFVHRLVPAAGDFAPGEKIAPLRVPGLPSGALICFEVIFPELAAKQARIGAKILVNLTNDAWFGMTSAPFQHLSMAVFRAVENRKPLVRAANTGISVFIDPSGKILSQGNLFREDILMEEMDGFDLPLPFYARHGDIFALILIIFSLTKMAYDLCYHRFFSKL